MIEIYLDKYVKGLLNENKYKYYTMTIPYNYYKIGFNLCSTFGKAFIKLGKEVIGKKDSSLREINSN